VTVFCEFVAFPTGLVVSQASRREILVIARDLVTSVKDLAKKLMRNIRHYNKTIKTVKWKYCDPSRRIGAQTAVMGH